MMNRTIESFVRFVNLTTSGLLAGSLGFGEAALVPGWHRELPHERADPLDTLKRTYFFNAIGPVALGSAVTLAIAGRGKNPVKRILDAAAAVGLAGVLAATVMVTVPIRQELEQEAPRDYPHDRAQSLAKNWTRAHKVRTSLGIGAFVCAVASNLTSSKDRSR
jgi:anthrone oxygenase-like protein